MGPTGRAFGLQTIKENQLCQMLFLYGKQALMPCAGRNDSISEKSLKTYKNLT